MSIVLRFYSQPKDDLGVYSERSRNQSWYLQITREPALEPVERLVANVLLFSQGKTTNEEKILEAGKALFRLRSRDFFLNSEYV